MKPKTLISGMLFMCFLVISNIGQSSESFQLFGNNENRGKVYQAAYSYYPDKGELRVQLTLVSRQVKTGVYQNEHVVNNLLRLFSSNLGDLYCSYDGNNLIAIGKFSNLQ